MITGDAPPTASTSTGLTSTPTAKLSALEDPTKKYTLIFLVSVGTTLLVTGASGGRLLKRAKSATAPAQTPPAAARASPPPGAARLSTFSTKPAPLPNLNRPPHVLKTFRVGQASSSALESGTLGGTTDFFLPNAVILDHSNKFAQKLDAEDRLHQDGPDQPDAPDDGFNPAVYAAKAFAIATVLTTSAFAAGIGGLMYYLGAEDLESLSLALSHSLPPMLASHRPSLPSWAVPTPSPDSSQQPAGAEAEEEMETDAETQEGVSYWTQVKQTLDREADERLVRRREEWERRFRAAEAKEGERQV